MWYAEFDQMSNIHAFETATHCDSDCRFWQGSSFAEPEEQLYMCGDHLTYASADPQGGEYTGAIASLTPSGKGRWYIKVSGGNVGGRNQDKCLGITMAHGTYNVGVLIQGKMAELRVTNDNTYDTILILLSADGQASKAISFTQGDKALDMYSAPGGLIAHDSGRNTDSFFFAGYSGGFATKYRTWLSGGQSWKSDNYDSYVYKFDFGQPYYTQECLYQTQVYTSGTINRVI